MARPWLPVEQQTTPGVPGGKAASAFIAPRSLKAPIGCVVSSLSSISCPRPGICDGTNGVPSACPRIAAAAASTSASVSRSVGILHRPQELLRPLFLRIGKELLRRGLFFDLAFVEKADAIRNVAGKAHLMPYHQHGQVMFCHQLGDDLAMLMVTHQMGFAR